MTKHTPGPWELVAAELVAGWVLTAANGIAVASVHMEGPTSGGPADRAETVANRSLIAAAPELLEALAEMVVHFGAVAALIAVEEEKRGVKRPRFDGIDASQKAIAMARAAIAKAEGR